jgi:hypothetical protein
LYQDIRWTGGRSAIALEAAGTCVGRRARSAWELRFLCCDENGGMACERGHNERQDGDQRPMMHAHFLPDRPVRTTSRIMMHRIRAAVPPQHLL